MENKHKNTLIGALIAIVFVMAVGYAAFMQQLTIHTTTTITDQTDNWNIHFDDAVTTGTPTIGSGGTNAPSGTISYDELNQTASIKATLNQPGDKVVFTLTIVNDGTINAILDTPVISNVNGDKNPDPLIVQTGNIIFTITAPKDSSIAASQTTTMTVTAEFDNSAESTGSVTSSSISVTTIAHQAV